MTYSHATGTTCAYLGFQLHKKELNARPSPGVQLLSRLRKLKGKSIDPMLMPALAAGLWVEYLHYGNYQSGKEVREIQNEIGLMPLYFQRQQKFIRQPMRFDEVHQKIVSQHAFLTTGIPEFIADLFPSTKNAMQTFRELRWPQQPQQQRQQQGPRDLAIESMEELDDYIDHMQVRARAELQHHDRMLNRMNVYLQVVSPTIAPVVPRQIPC